MASLLGALLFTHVLANLVWIGSLLAVGLVSASADFAARERGALARRIYLRLAVPAFLLSFASGLVRLLLDIDLYLVRTHYMHAKLLFAVIVIGLHHLLGARARRLAEGRDVSTGVVNALSAAILVSAAAATYLVLTKAF
jgi:putative membrane protein